MKNQIFAIAALCGTVLMMGACSKNANELQQSPAADMAYSDAGALNDVEAVDDRIVFTQVVQLEGSQEVPAVLTNTKGIAILRVSEGKKLYSKIIIQKLADGDRLRFAHIHAGAKGANGPVSIGIAANAADFGVNKEFQLTDAQFQLITAGAAYVNAHSNFSPTGIVRGQIR